MPRGEGDDLKSLHVIRCFFAKKKKKSRKSLHSTRFVYRIANVLNMISLIIQSHSLLYSMAHFW